MLDEGDEYFCRATEVTGEKYEGEAAPAAFIVSAAFFLSFLILPVAECSQPCQERQLQTTSR